MVTRLQLNRVIRWGFVAASLGCGSNCPPEVEEVPVEPPPSTVQTVSGGENPGGVTGAPWDLRTIVSIRNEWEDVVAGQDTMLQIHLEERLLLWLHGQCEPDMGLLEYRHSLPPPPLSVNQAWRQALPPVSRDRCAESAVPAGENPDDVQPRTDLPRLAELLQQLRESRSNFTIGSTPSAEQTAHRTALLQELAELATAESVLE